MGKCDNNRFFAFHSLQQTLILLNLFIYYIYCVWYSAEAQAIGHIVLASTQEESHSGGTSVEFYTNVTLLSTLMSQK